MTNNILTLEKIIEYIDVPQLFLARDKFDTQYICLLYEDDPICRYTAVRISPQQYACFTNKKIDLRSIYTAPEQTGEYFNVEYIDNNYVISHFEGTELPDERLPEEGFYYDDPDMESITVQIPKKEKSLFLRFLNHRGWVAM